ncbi:Hypothetical Protein OBI_RACECAR_188 [Arthrobacter phage Racecar]|nr:hypothetical protein PBI_RACECAR_270 [Arthrobacter phage Racecar]
MANPPNLQYCKVVGNFKAFIADNQDDDDLPDFVPMSGTGQIWPNVTMTKNTQVGYKSTYFNSPISIIVDEDGDLSQGGRKYINVLAESANLNPATFNYTILLNMYAQGESISRTYGPFAFDIVPGGEVDITDVIPVSAYGGNPIVQGPQGEPGDLVGVTTGSWTGAVTLNAYPQTYLATLTGNVTSLALPASPIGLQSGTITLVLTQDATGGRTITWPAGVKWPDGIVQQPAGGPNTVSVFHLMWTGTQWIGMLGGKSFA